VIRIRNRSCCVVDLLWLFSSASIHPTFAHHSFASTFFLDRTVTIEADVVQFAYRNPHSLLTVIAADGSRTRWVIEWAGTLDLRRSGVDKNAIQSGDHVILVAYPSRNPVDHRLRLKTIERPSDGWKWTRPFD
jgi:Family of unknown function (DUF6152)